MGSGAVAGRVAGEAGVGGHVDLAAEDRLDPGLPGRPVELDRPRDDPVVGEGEGRHREVHRPPNELPDPAHGVQERVLGVDVEVDKRHATSVG